MAAAAGAGKLGHLTDPKANSPEMKLDPAALQERVRQTPWFHSIDLGNGIVTPGGKPPAVHHFTASRYNDLIPKASRRRAS